TLITAGIREANTLVLCSDDDGLNLAILTQARVINPHIRIVNRIFNETLGERLDKILPHHFSMSVSEWAAPIFTFAAFGSQAIGQLQLFNKTWPIYEEVIDANHPWLGMPLSQLWTSLERMLIYYLPAKGEQDLISAVVHGDKLELGDHLVIGTQPKVSRNRRPKPLTFLKALTNFGKFNRHGRPIAIVMLALLVTILLATVTYVSVNFNTSIIDALYFSVGMITGAGGQEQVAEQAPDSIKLFTAIMMIVGAGVIGICYALINDFVLGSRLKQFWDAARIPPRNHYIVCGLGEIGMKIVHQLLKQGQEVVVIEKDHNNRFLHTARSLGVPVIIEDSRIANTLKAANIAKAAALLAVTSDDMANVEIALCAKAITSGITVVARHREPQFAESVQEVFGFDNVLCPTELATPSFVAAALGGKVLGHGMTADLLWIAVGTLITPAHPFCNKTVKDAAMDADFVPLYLDSNNKTIHGRQLLEIHLQPGDILFLTMPAKGLELLWRVDDSLPVLSY
ncbi:MAG: NAD-binding protein, partial [Spirulinaceae cyanobacterium]